MATVSVIIPSYNHCNYIGKAIESVLSQSYTDFELLISDDCSKDNSVEVIKQYKDDRIRTFFREKNVGAVLNTNSMIKEAKGKYIALLNSDDYWLPNKLEYQIQIMESNSFLGACFTWGDIIDERGRVLTEKDVLYADVLKQKNRSQGKWLHRFFFKSNCLAHPSMLIKSEIYDELGLYKNYLRQIPDYEMWIRLIKKYPIYIIEQSLIIHRRHLKTNLNSTAETEENEIRGINELNLVYTSFFDGVSDNVFKDGFHENFIYSNANSHEEMLCEQAFLLLNNQLARNACRPIGLAKLANLLENEKTRNILSSIYNFTETSFYNLMSTNRGDIKMEDIVLFGAGSHAKVAIDIIEKEKKYNLIGLIDPFREIGEYQCGYPILGNYKDISILNKVYGGLVAIGDNWTRYKVSLLIKTIAPNFHFINTIHPSAVIAKNVSMGEGVLIMAGASVGTYAKICNHSWIGTLSSVDHESTLGNYASVSANCSLGGNVNIGDFTAVCLAANVIHKISVGKHTVIGAGSTVVRNIPSFVVAYGTPCKIVRKRTEGDKYL